MAAVGAGEVDLAEGVVADFMEAVAGSAEAGVADLVAEQAADSAAARGAVWQGEDSEAETLVAVPAAEQEQVAAWEEAETLVALLAAGQEVVDSEVEQAADWAAAGLIAGERVVVLAVVVSVAAGWVAPTAADLVPVDLDRAASGVVRAIGFRLPTEVNSTVSSACRPTKECLA